MDQRPLTGPGSLLATGWLALFATMVAALLLSSQDNVLVKLVAGWLVVANAVLVGRARR